MARRPAVAGMFYEADEAGLLGDLERCFYGDFGPGRLPETRRAQDWECDRACVARTPDMSIPAGRRLLHILALAEDGLPDTVVILGPNHYGVGAPVALSPDDAWKTPLGTLELDEETAREIIRLCGFAREDEPPHLREHSIEVQLPFLQFIGGIQVKIVPISIAHLSLRDATQAAIRTRSRDGSRAQRQERRHRRQHRPQPLRIQSTHGCAGFARDRTDAPPGRHGLLETVHHRDISMCGAIGTAAMIEAAKILGATHAHELTHYTSGRCDGDIRQVVGYGAISVGKA